MFMAGRSRNFSDPTDSKKQVLSKEIRIMLITFLGMILLSGTITLGMGLTNSTRNKIQQTIKSADENKLSTIAVTTLPIITVIREKIYNQEK